MKIKIDSELSWLTAYLKRISRIINLGKIKTIQSVKYDKKVNRGSYAECVKYENETQYHVKLDQNYQVYRHHRDGTWSVKLKPHSKIDILCLLAHELAHTGLWNHDHSPDHKLLEARITTSFMKQLNRENYKNEEDELKTKDVL